MAAKAAFSFRAEHIWLSRPINGDPHEMSRGLGQTEQEILALIEEEGEDRPYAAEELANAIYRPNAGDDGCCAAAGGLMSYGGYTTDTYRLGDHGAIRDAVSSNNGHSIPRIKSRQNR